MRTPSSVRLVTASAVLACGLIASAQSSDKSPPQHIARLMTIGIDGSDPRVLFETADIQAPNWTPDGKWLVYLSFPPDTMKHPADKAVILRRMKPDGSEQVDIIAFNGGQGTVNVNSWSPDSKRFAFVMYPLVGEALSKPLNPCPM